MQISALIRSQINQLDAYQTYDPRNDLGGNEECMEDIQTDDPRNGSNGDDEGTEGIQTNGPGDAWDSDEEHTEGVLPHNVVHPCVSPPTQSTFQSNDHFILGSF